MATVPNRNSNRAIEIGDTVSYGNGIGEGKVTHIVGNTDKPHPINTKYKVDSKQYWNHAGVKKVKKGK